MENKLTVVMYHYVRDLKNSRYPEIKGLDKELFIGQVDYIKRHYNPVTMEQVMDFYDNNTPLPKKAILLTFDDGYADHFNTVFPILLNRGIQGSFFAPIKAIVKKQVLDVNKIHFILASCKNKNDLIAKIKLLLVKYKDQYKLDSFENYYSKLAIAGRFDTADVIFIKRLLQVELPLETRILLLNELFTSIVGISEDAFSRELYMNKEQLRCMVNCGMHIGSHGYDHFWFSSLNKDQQKEELNLSLEFIKDIYGDKFKRWSICYPYGDYNDDTLLLLNEMNCSTGFTTTVEVSNLETTNKFTISRIDTNDLPKNSNSEINDWFTKG